jgi:hypothetical protein
MVGTIKSTVDPYPNDTEFSVTELVFAKNPYRAELSFPYSESTYPVLFMSVVNSNKVKSMPSPLQYLFETGLSTASVNESKIDSYMEQTRYLTCLAQNASFAWVQ